MRWILMPAMWLGLALLSGCAKPALLTSQMTDPEIRAQLADHFHEGMTYAEVNGELDALNISDRWRLRYKATETRPEVLLARLYPPGGFWVDGGDDTVEFVDVSFIFDPTQTLTGWKMLRDSVRYFNGGVAYGSTRPTMAPIADFPAAPPPPKDPLEFAS